MQTPVLADLTPFGRVAGPEDGATGQNSVVEVLEAADPALPSVRGVDVWHLAAKRNCLGVEPIERPILTPSPV